MHCGKTSDVEPASDDDVNRPLLGRASCFLNGFPVKELTNF
jgi:hypothetical protein